VVVAQFRALPQRLGEGTKKTAKTFSQDGLEARFEAETFRIRKKNGSHSTTKFDPSFISVHTDIKQATDRVK
jgi:hypothetical protein